MENVRDQKERTISREVRQARPPTIVKRLRSLGTESLRIASFMQIPTCSKIVVLVLEYCLWKPHNLRPMSEGDSFNAVGNAAIICPRSDDHHDYDLMATVGVT